MSGCGDVGRCCDGPNCQKDRGKCSCQNCSGKSWRYDNDCTPGACWTVEDGVFSCTQKNPCECEYIGGEFGGAGTQCPNDDTGPKPPPPAPPVPPDPGPVLRWICERGVGCYPVEYICGPDIDPAKCYWSERDCNGRCSVRPPPPPPPPPPPDKPCIQDIDCSGGNCCNGECCDLNCCGGVCSDAPCGDCETDGDCEFWLLSPVKNDNPECTAEFFNYYFATFDDAFDFGLLVSGSCGPFEISAVFGKCCNSSCHPSDLPFGTDSYTLACP